jgi:chemotaxis protein MotB
MVLMFVLTVFMIVQFALRETINTQDDELAVLNSQLSGLADALGMERARSADLEAEIGTLTSDLQLAGERLAAAEARIGDFEAQVAALLAEAGAREATISAQEEAARLAEARRKALEALVADLRAEGAETAAKLTEAETARLTEAAAAAALRDRLRASEDELTAMTLALEESRRKAEETLTLLAAAEAAKRQLAEARAAQLTEAEKRQALLAAAEAALAGEKALSAESARKVALLNEQVAALRRQLGGLQELLDASAARDAEAKVQIDALGTQLNSALARVAAEEKRRAALEAAEAERLAAEAQAARDEAKELAKYRSEFFGRLSELLAGREGVRVVGDRFVFSSEVLFEPGSAALAPEGQSQIESVVRILEEVAVAIPPGIDWIIRVDGHTDNVPLAGGGAFADNWELSQGRALSVVRYMQDVLGFPPERLAAAGFGEYRPVAQGDSASARALNRRIELKLTER